MSMDRRISSLSRNRTFLSYTRLCFASKIFEFRSGVQVMVSGVREARGFAAGFGCGGADMQPSVAREDWLATGQPVPALSQS